MLQGAKTSSRKLGSERQTREHSATISAEHRADGVSQQLTLTAAAASDPTDPPSGSQGLGGNGSGDEGQTLDEEDQTAQGTHHTEMAAPGQLLILVAKELSQTDVHYTQSGYTHIQLPTPALGNSMRWLYRRR